MNEKDPRDQRHMLNYAPPETDRAQPGRKAVSTILVVAGLFGGISGALMDNESARVNIWTAVFGLIMFGVVISFQHVRL